MSKKEIKTLESEINGFTNEELTCILKEDKKTNLKLKIELIPRTAWGSNLRKLVKLSEWKKISNKCRHDANYKCEICGSDGRNTLFISSGSKNGTLDCHEVWEYDEVLNIQKLNGLIALCADCHMIKHLGLAGIMSSKGLLDMDKLIEHFMKVNGVDKDRFNTHREAEVLIYKNRTRKQWTQNISKYVIINGSD